MSFTDLYADAYTDLYGQAVAASAFPDTPLDVRTELLLGGTWTDVTPWNDHGPITIGRGHPDESTTTSPSTLAVTLTNTDGRLTSKNPTGPYYPNLMRNVPSRISIPSQTPYLRLPDTTGYINTPSSSGLNVAGDLEVQMDLRLDGFTTTDTAIPLVSKWAASGQFSWFMELQTAGQVRFWRSTTGSNYASVDSTLPLPLGRTALKVTYATATGTVTFYTAPNIGGSWTQLGSAVTISGGGTIFASTAAVWIGSTASSITGRAFALKVLSGIGGAAVASPDFTSATPGAATLTDAQANVWTLGGTAEFSARSYRFHGEVAEWPQSQDASGKTVTVAAVGGGLLRRHAQRNSPVDSTLKRAILSRTGTLAVDAYWPAEDLQGATQIGSASGGLPMSIIGGTGDGTTTHTGPAFAADSSFACSLPLPTLNGSTWLGKVPAYNSNGSIVVRFPMKLGTTLPASATALVRVITTGTCQEFSLQFNSSGYLTLAGYGAGSSGTVFTSGAITAPSGGSYSGQLQWVSMELTPSGGSVNAGLFTLQPGGTSAYGSTYGTFTGTVGNVVAVYVNPWGIFPDTTIGHISVQSGWESMYDLQQPLQAWQGELAGHRFLRLCAESGVAARCYGAPDVTAAMGTQTAQTLVALLQECEDADRGQIIEPRQVLGLGYRTQAALLNQPPAVTVDYSVDDLSMWSADPREDDQTTQNDITLTQTTGGSSARQYAAPGQPIGGGRLSTLPPPAGVGTYDQSFSVNLASDSQLNDLAGWYLHLGTVDEPRFPGIVLDLANRDLAALYWAILDMDLGDRLVIDDLPPWLPPDPVSQICQHVDETLWAEQLEIGVTGVPESPYETAIFDDPVYGRDDTNGSTLAAGVTATATSLSVATTDTVTLWTTAAGDLPFDIAVSGERMTVTAISGTSSPQAFTVIRSVNSVAKSHLTGEDVRLWFPPIAAML